MSWRQAANAVMELLLRLQEESAGPERAMAMLAELRARRHEKIDLVWDREPDGSGVHYDALVDVEDLGTMSISFCPDRGVPWPFRGASLWSDGELLKVDGTPLYVNQAIEFLDLIWREERLMTRLIDSCIIRGILAKEPIEVSGEELQAAIDEFRRKQGLLSADDTEAWMKSRGLDLPHLEELLEDQVRTAKLRKRIVGPVENEQIEKDLFAAWLEKKRKESRIEWNWGRSSK